MVFFWLFALLSGISSVAFASVIWQLDPVPAILVGILMVLTLRGSLSVIRRWLVLHERRADISDTVERTLETNRYIFWRRVLILAVLLGAYTMAVELFFGMTPSEGLAALVTNLPQVALTVLQVGLIMMFQFLIFFGPFVLFGRIGRQTILPGDADYDVKIEDVRGQKAAVGEMTRILRLMEQGRNYVKAGGKRERGVLMVGPPGTGKTMLAKAIASTMHVPIITTSGASFAGMFMGMDVVNVYTMIRAAKKKAKRWGGCTIFIDEFDALGTRRSGMGGMPGGMGGMFGMGGSGMGLNMLLVLMDGVDQAGFIRQFFRRLINVCLDGLFIPRKLGVNGSALSLRIPNLKPPNYNLMFIGATNRPSVLDEAVTRPGRFGRTITFRNPTRESRKDIAELYFNKKKHDPALDTPERREEFARVTEGYSPAMIEQALSLALMYAFEDGRDAFVWKDLREAMGNIEAGLAEPVEYTERDKLAVARHELGHAVASRFYEPEKSSVRLSIRMRSGSLGHHYNIDKEEQFVHFRSKLAGRLRCSLGAIAAERVFYGENSSGVTMDLIQATSLASAMVGIYGMGPDRLEMELSRKAADIGEYHISLAEAMMAGEEDSRTGPILRSPMARRTVAQILGAAYMDSWRLMHANKDAIDLAAEALMAQGELVGDEVDGLLDSVNLRAVEDSDPYPDAVEFVPASAFERDLRRMPADEPAPAAKAAGRAG